MNSRRTKMQIYIDILRTIQKSNGRMRKTHIVYKANLTHMRLKEYLEFLMEKDFIDEETAGRETWFAITPKGADFLRDINKLRKISDAFGVPL
jgi:predicted transcriptional regulator